MNGLNMAVDTRNKRFSMMGLLQPVPSLLPNPDGAVDAQDRAMHLFLYFGLVLTAPAAALTFGIYSFINPQGQGVVANISEDGQGVLGVISQSMGVFAKISEDGQGVSGEIDETGQGVNGGLS